MNNPVSRNPLRTRADVSRAAAQLLEPLIPLMSEGKARLHLGETGAVYPAHIAEMEAFSRPLWAIVPMLMGGCPEAEPLWKHWREGLANGTNPKHLEYWGELADYDQRMVEMAVIGMGLCFLPHAFFLDYPEETRRNIHAWLFQINRHTMPDNNWRFFRVLVNLGLRLCGQEYDAALLEDDLAQVEAHYEGDGWYFDYPTQRDYYTFWAFHYYGLVYARAAGELDPERAARFRARARTVAPRFAHWFDRDGRALPYGRSLPYRFAESAFFSALAFDEQQAEGVDYGVMKHILLGNMREWMRRPIFTRDGVLTIGYGYPNLVMSEGYNAPGSPYWSMKAFIALALPEEHPFWRAEEKPFEAGGRFLEEHASMLLTRAEDGSHVQAFIAGNHCEGHAHAEAKYEKFCYSTAFAFSTPKSSLYLHHGAYDSMLAFSETGTQWHIRYGTHGCALRETGVRFTWSPMTGVTVDTTLYPAGEWHIRVHRIVSDRPLKAAEGGYAIHREEDRIALEARVSADQAAGIAPWGMSGIRALRGYRSAELLPAEPNTNLLYPRTAIPTLHADIPAGTSMLICAVLGTVTGGEVAWERMPGEKEIEAALAFC